ncbi:MAG: asparaginase [Flavobacteriales bacterium]
MKPILLIYTGGTIGMMHDKTMGSLVPFDFEQLREYAPELNKFNFAVEHVALDAPIDSSDVSIATWQQIAKVIEVNYAHYHGFVVLHGTDTMAYTASALSFMLENIGKPVILTGSQLPIGVLRTDAKENLISAIELAAMNDKQDEPVLQEVAIYFNSRLMRGNRTVKNDAQNFDAFRSPDFVPLAEIGVHIEFAHALLLRPAGRFKVQYSMSSDIALLKIFPSIKAETIESMLNTKGLRAVVLETFGAGNFPQRAELHQLLRAAIDRGIHIVNITQCAKGMVEQGLYETSTALQSMGVLSGKDMTTETAIAKLMYLLGQNLPHTEVRDQLLTPLRGELTLAQQP